MAKLGSQSNFTFFDNSMRICIMINIVMELDAFLYFGIVFFLILTSDKIA